MFKHKHNFKNNIGWKFPKIVYLAYFSFWSFRNTWYGGHVLKCAWKYITELRDSSVSLYATR